MAQDPFKTLGLSPSATDAEVRSAYRRLVQLHHPDHNNGSEEAERRFEEVQEAYAQVRELRSGGGARPGTARPTTPPPAPDPAVDSRLADLERELREAQQARRRAEQDAREAAREAAADATARGPSRATDEELGYVSTNDTFSKILSDARREFSDRLSGAAQSDEAKRAADLIEQLGAVLRGERPKRSDD
ncbi:MAG: hypothetical protein QOD66_680 [Solirubrobacteraceae bacterium]|jgi:hypothetical protein|nr:hypothetical protein [Solirubrobacteraceae bacterium]